MHQGTSTVRPFPNLSQSVLDRTVEVLRQAEHLLIKRSQVRWKKAEVVLDSVWHGPSFVVMGLGAQAQLAGLAVVLLLVWWVALVAMLGTSRQNRGTYQSTDLGLQRLGGKEEMVSHPLRQFAEKPA